jgi:mxaJ protein
MIATVLVALALLYALGVRAAWRAAGHGRSIRMRQAWCFAAGIVVLVIALIALDSMADQLFAAHMAQHVLLAIVAPPLLVAGAPLVAALWILPVAVRRRVVAAVHGARWLQAAWRTLTIPAVACLAHAVALWGWHVPALYLAALAHPALHFLEHASFLGSASLIWWGILYPRRERRAALASGILVIFLTMVQSGALGALIVFSHRLWFPAQAVDASRWGLTPIEDQQLAGLSMWIPGGLLYLVAIGALFVRWMDQSRRRSLALSAVAALAVSGCVRSDSAFRVCADPNNLPFSDSSGAGFENRIAELFARDLHEKVEYTWQAQRRGFVRSTLRAGDCDVVMGVPAAYELTMPTQPYYRSTYVFVTRADRHLAIKSFDDPALRHLRVGLHFIGDDYSNSPAATSLAKRGLGKQIVGYTIYGDYAKPHPPSDLIDAVIRGDVDVAVAWGPLAGYFAKYSSVPLTLTPVSPAIDLPFTPFVYDIAIGVRRGDSTRRMMLDSEIVRRRGDIRQILDSFGVPVVGR